MLREINVLHVCFSKSIFSLLLASSPRHMNFLVDATKQQTLIAFVKLSGVFCGKQKLIRIQAFNCLGETLFREPFSGPSMMANFLANRLEESKSRRRKIPFVKSLLFSSSPFICQSKSGEKDGNCLFLLFSSPDFWQTTTIFFGGGWQKH